MMDWQEENKHVLSLVQAMLGSITPNFRTVFLTSTTDGIQLHFVLGEESAEDREEIEDIVAEFEALQEGYLDVDMIVSVNTGNWSELLPVSCRMVYARKEQSLEDPSRRDG